MRIWQKKSNLVIAGAVALLSLGTASAQAITITPTDDGNTLVNELLDLGSGITVSNIVYTGANGASGTFTGGLSSGLGIDTGIILTTGQASSAVGPNDSDATTTANGYLGDPDLNNLIPGYSTQDATKLKFDFETAGGDLYFNYVFASEEYNEWVNSAYNDVFGFFLDGVNIALIPSTTTPVSINNVNSGLNSGFYNNNDPSDLGIPTPFDIEYDGFTTNFQAQALGIGAGTHTIELKIADAGDQALDSAVFINGFSDSPNIPEPSSLLGILTTGALGIKSLIKGRQGNKV